MILQENAEAAKAAGGIIGVVLGLVVGGLVGWVASIIMKTNAQMGAIANVLVGIVGSWIGGVVYAMLGLPASSLGGLVAAIAGASLFIVVLRAIRVLK